MVCRAQELKTVTLRLRPDRSRECLVLQRMIGSFTVAMAAVELQPAFPSALWKMLSLNLRGAVRE